MFCNGGPQHLFRYCKYCGYCAIKQKQLGIVFYCQMCDQYAKQQHDSHSDQCTSLNHSSFTSPLSAVKALLLQQIQRRRQIFIKNRRTYHMSDFNQVLGKLQQKNCSFLRIINSKKQLHQVIMDGQLMQWLLDMKFWQSSKQNTLLKFNQKLINLIKTKITQFDKQLYQILYQVRSVVNVFQIKWNPELIGQEMAKQNDISSIISTQTSTLEQESAKLNKQRDIFRFVIKLFASYNIEQCFDTLDYCQQMIRRYPKSKILYLGKIRLFELIAERHKQIPKILKQIVKEIDPKFDQTDLYYYYLAQSQWKMIQSPEEIDPKDKYALLFFQLKNKQYYQLLNVQNYMNNIKKANSIREKGVYWACLGIGYIVKKDYQQAVRMFNNASATMNCRNNAVDLNKFWSQINNPYSNLQFQAIMQNLQTRPLQFITNISKYFKKQRQCQQLVKCCQQLLSRQPSNQKFKVQWIKSILYYSSGLNDFSYEDRQKQNRAQTLLTELKRVRQNQANKLEKRLLRMKGRHQFKKQNLSEAIDSFNQVTRRNKYTSSTDYFNLASTLFKKYIKQSCDDQDLIKQGLFHINQAIKLNQQKQKPPKIKHLKLKFFLCCYMRFFNQAHKLYEEYLKHDEIDGIRQDVYLNLIEHIKNNLQEQWDDPTGQGMKMN